LLEKAEQYERSTREPTQEAFLRTAQIRTKRTEDGHTLSVHQLRTWRKGYGLPYPLVPASDDQRRPILVYLIDADDRTLLWISANVREVLDYEPWELIGRLGIEALSPGHDARREYPQLCAEFTALRDGGLESSAPPPAYIVHRNGSDIPVQIQGAYGARNHAFYVQATVLACAADTRQNPLFNVEPYIFQPLSTKHSVPRGTLEQLERYIDALVVNRTS
jgi:hypothetical protein